MDDTGLINCIDNDKTASSLVFIATEPSFYKIHYRRANALLCKISIRSQSSN